MDNSGTRALQTVSLNVTGSSWNQSRANDQFGLSEIPGSSMDWPRTTAGYTVSLEVTGSFGISWNQSMANS